MTNPNQDVRNVLLVVAVVALFELFRPAPAMTQRSIESQLRDVVHELRGIKQELGSIERKMK